ncbi:MAG: CehA/McbA family metallohydrolase [Armatimonadetes bacterium]|nr:CehA/McbA family metallohydrolase [Armatimonadota bacterium]MDW8121144.1 CehA/McbA family metallohydrolase [Armatimonadota bacterium]
MTSHRCFLHWFGWFFILTLAATGWGRVRVYEVQRVDDLPPSVRRGGRVGDWVIHNDQVAFVIKAINRPHRSAPSGGNIVDAGLLGWSTKRKGVNDLSGADELDQVFLFLGKYPRQGRYQRLTATVSADGRSAEIVVSGVDSEDGTLSVTTIYRLAERVPYIEMETTARNNGTVSLKKMMLGDGIHWGFARPFAPRFGFGIARNEGTADWTGGNGERVAYGWTCPSAPFRVMSGLNWTNAVATTVDLDPGEEVVYRRYFIVGRDLAEVARWGYHLSGETVVRLTGFVRSRSGKEVPDVPVEAGRISSNPAGKNNLLEKAVPVALARTDPTGAFQFWLPRGQFRLVAMPKDRWSLKSAIVTVTDRPLGPLVVWVTEPGTVRFAVRDERTFVPSRLTILGLAGTPNPDLGPDYKATGAANYLYDSDGKGTITLAPGRYRFVASRGPEYDIAWADAFLPEGETVDISLNLKRSVDTTGWISADFHTHTSQSFDSAVTVTDRLVSAAAEGLDVLVLTDHNVVTDPTEALAESGLNGLLTVISGVELTTRHLGHFTVFPLIAHPHLEDGGAPPFDSPTAEELLKQVNVRNEEPVIVVAHPRFGNIGYFHLHQWPEVGKPPPEGFSLDFDGMELMNGKAQDDLWRLIRDWFFFLNRGKRVIGVAGSDSHGLVYDEVGYARNYLFVGDQEPAKISPELLKKTVRNGSLVVSLGPFISFTINDAPIGSFVSMKDDTATFRITVEAANWVPVDRVELIANGRAIKGWDLKRVSGRSVQAVLNGTVMPDRDSWYVAMVTGPAGGLEPVLKPFRGRGGKVLPVQPIAITNPIWVDADKDGQFRPFVDDYGWKPFGNGPHTLDEKGDDGGWRDPT